jgi:hypothetical protein
LGTIFFLSGVLVPLLVGGIAIFVVLKIVRSVGAAGPAAGGSGDMVDPVSGSLLVTAAAMPSRRAVFHMTRITGIISADGIDPVAVQFNGLIRTAQWPSPGQTLPVTVDRADPNRFAIEWDKVGASADQALARAQALAATMRDRAGS